jgi:hypothetical protein
MLSTGLEKLIQTGKAQFKTWVHGVGGVGRIPIPEDGFIIITHFDYFGFIDVPEAPAEAPATATVNVSFGLNATCNIRFDLFGFGSTGGFLFDSSNVPASLLLGQADLSASFPGFSLSINVLGGNVFDFVITTTSPGVAYNGNPVTMNPIAPLNPVIVVDGVFAGGVESIIPMEEVLARATHQLQFKSDKSQNHFIIRDDVYLFDLSVAGAVPPNNYFLSVLGSYNKDTYLIHAGDCVDIEILTVPDPNLWALSNYSQLPNKSQEPNLPVGYGQSPLGVPTVREVRLDSGLLDQQYLPLTASFENIAPIPGKYREQFSVDANTINKLNSPIVGINAVKWNRRSYPIINIDYVAVNMNINQFVQSS